MPAAIPRDDLLAELCRLGENDDPPTKAEMRSDGVYGCNTYIRRFGSWTEALETAGYSIPQNRRNSGSRERVIDRLRQAAADLGHTPSSHELEQHESTLSRRQIYNYFDSWDEALEAAGLNGERPTHCRECGHEFDSSSAWALHRTRIHGENAPDVGLLEAIHDLADGGDPPMQKDMERSGAYSVGVYGRVYGSWPAALREAGYDPSRDAHNRIPTEDLLGEIQRLADKLGYAPRVVDMRQYGCYSIPTYTTRFGGWVGAQKAAGVGIHRAPKGEGEDITYTGGWDTARQAALERDGYVCQDCGLADAAQREQYGCGLNVHHKTPYREFDDPERAHELSNLVTLCQACHSRRHSAE